MFDCGSVWLSKPTCAVRLIGFAVPGRPKSFLQTLAVLDSAPKYCCPENLEQLADKTASSQVDLSDLFSHFQDWVFTLMRFCPHTSSFRPRLFSFISVFLFAGVTLLGASIIRLRESLAQRASDTVQAETTRSASSAEQKKLAGAYGKLPLSFERNQGQHANPVKFVSHGVGYSLFLTPDEAVLTLCGHAAGEKVGGKDSGAEGFKVVRMKLVGANGTRK